jgi:wyosine [tRNA(Phe)-imidazoG37] synthetase (radical SAM superfamily)
MSANPTSAHGTPGRLLPLIDGIVYGPVSSRRLGRSLGVNILPAGRKVCSFNCVYCQYGWTDLRTDPQLLAWPSPDEVAGAVEAALRALEPDQIDRLTLAGHGEPTLHPAFPAIVDTLRAVRDREAPRARLAVLTNGSGLARPAVREALCRVDECCVKLDGGDAGTIRRMNAIACDVATHLDAVASLPGVIVQALFVRDPRGRCGNDADEAIERWAAAIARLRPRAVHVYTIARGTALPRLEPVPRERLEAIAARVASSGIAVEVFT